MTGLRNLAVGVGASRGVAYAEIADTLRTAMDSAALALADVAAVASIAAKRDEPALHALARWLDADLLWFPAELLAAVPIPNPSTVVRRAVGTPSVAEAAALVAATGGTLLIPKTRSGRCPSMCTIAVARHRVGG